ncbi:MAG: Gfo/Idh/MocA family oxidoreductase [Candidatus Promineifilaceae bacterium]|nr:Gfo/Idh/MocA family oxidoreductase [Candidatus Promineifilaceae bacterium]
MKVIQIGVGGFGAYWLRILGEYPGIELAALVDVDADALSEAALLAGVAEAHCFQELEKALERVTADILVCVSPPHFHRQHTTAAMKAGLDVICEKPLAIDMEDALAMARAAQETGRLMTVSQNYRYRPVTWTMQKLVAGGEIGEIGQISLDFYKGWYFDSNDFRRTMPQPLISDMGIHHFDLLRFITGLGAVSVRGESWNPPWSKNKGDTSTNLTFILENGARFAYSASWCAQGNFTDWNGNWLIEGDRGSLHYRSSALTLNHADDRYQVQDSHPLPPVGPPLLDQAYILADLIAARQEKRQPQTSIFDNLNSLAMVTAAREAACSGEQTQILTFDEMLD